MGAKNMASSSGWEISRRMRVLLGRLTPFAFVMRRAVSLGPEAINNELFFCVIEEFKVRRGYQTTEMRRGRMIIG